MLELDRRNFLQMIGIAAGASVFAGPSFAAAKDTVTIAWPQDVPSWDPNLRVSPDPQSIYKMVYDQPLNQDPQLKFVPNLITKWDQAADGKSLTVTLRDDVTFHDGSKMTADDFKFTFFERGHVLKHKLDTSSIWGSVTDIEVKSPTEAVMKFAAPFPTVVPWLGFLGSFVVSKAHVTKVGADGFATAPLGTGPYKVKDYERDSRITLERNDAYWGPKPAIKTVTIQIIKDPSARLAALQSGQVDLAISIPVRETLRLQKDANFSAGINPIQRVIIMTVRSDGPLADQNIRLACHHAIDKKAISKAFYGGEAVPLSVVATPGNPGYPADFTFEYSPDKAKELLAKAGHGPDNPVKLKFATFNGNFPGDYDIARAVVQMWKKVGIDAELEVIEYAKWFELNRADKLQDISIYSWDNATGDPEIYIGYLMNPHLPFSTFRTGDIGTRAAALFGEPDNAKRIAAYTQLNEDAVNQATIIPLLQAVMTVVTNKDLEYKKYEEGFILGQEMNWKA
jgi:peptide/nickel transport system substrate-binding protein